MLEEVHKGLCPIDTLKVAIDRRLLSHFLGAACGSPYIVFISTSGM